MKVTAISDLHGNLIDIESCDLLCICGDISPLDIQKDYLAMWEWIFNKFIPWINSIDCYSVCFTPGNHDFWFQKYMSEFRIKQAIHEATYKKLFILIDTLAILPIAGKSVKIYGTPWCKTFGNWAFMPGNYCLDNKYSNIPENIDILMCHDSPSTGEVGYIHYDEPLDNGETKIPAGNFWLADAIDSTKPKYVLSGHVHSGDHELKTYGETKYANCSILDESYSIYYKPLTFEL